MALRGRILPPTTLSYLAISKSIFPSPSVRSAQASSRLSASLRPLRGAFGSLDKALRAPVLLPAMGKRGEIGGDHNQHQQQLHVSMPTPVIIAASHAGKPFPHLLIFVSFPSNTAYTVHILYSANQDLKISEKK